MKPYDELTKTGKRRRLYRLVREALADYDLAVTRVRFLVQHTNTYFRVDTEDGQKYAVRIYSHDSSPAENEAEMFWLEALNRDTSLHVLTPVARKDGRFLTTLSPTYLPEPQRLALYHWVPGRHLADEWTPANYIKLGECLAHLHNHAASLRLPAHIRPKRWTEVFYYPDERIVYRHPTFSHLFPPERVELLDQVIAHVNPFLQELYTTQGPPILIHGDLHVWNVHVHDGKLYLIDFEDLLLGYPLHDVAITLYYGRSLNHYPDLVTALHTGYTRLRPWPIASARQLDTLIAARSANFVNFAAWVDEDPADYIAARCEELAAFLEQYG